MIFSKETRKRLTDLEISVRANLQTTFNIAAQINEQISRLNEKVFPLIEKPYRVSYPQNDRKIVPQISTPCVTIRCQCGTEVQAAQLVEAVRRFKIHTRTHARKPRR